MKFLNYFKKNDTNTQVEYDPKRKKNLIKKRLIIIGISLLIILVVFTIYQRYYIGSQPLTKIGDTQPFKLKSIPKTEASPVNGEMVEKSLANRYPMAVVIENHPDARPQSGLDNAMVVYEAISEGGITRFLAIFSARDAHEIGPVRSARTFFLDWASEYGAYFAHAGGALDALRALPNSNVYDLKHTQGYFQRINRGKVAVEHTLYTSTEDLYKLATKLKYPTTPTFTPLKYKEEKALNDRDDINAIKIPFSTDSYQVDWTYDKNNNEYLRSMAGSPHKDRISGNQLKAKVVVVMEVNRAPIHLEGAKDTFKFDTIGTGDATVFQDGEKITGKWKKTSQKENTIFSDQDGKEISINRGVRFVEVIPPDVTISSTSSISSTTP